MLRVSLLIAIAGAASVNWWSRWPRRQLIEMISKPLVTVMVIAVAATSGARAAEVAFAVVALALCLVGDVVLLPAIDRFVVGLGAFLTGHLGFVLLFVVYGVGHGALALGAVGAALLIGATVGRRIVIGAARTRPALAVPVVAYLVVILTMAVIGWGTGRGWVLIGTTAFVISDALLGWEVFVDERPWLSVAVMVTYHAAIVALALSL